MPGICFVISLASTTSMQARRFAEGVGFSCIFLQQHTEAVAHPMVGVGRKKERF